MKKNRFRLATNVLLSVGALAIAAIHVVPLWITVTNSLKTRSDLSSNWILPKQLAWDNFTKALDVGNLPRAFYNTIVITLAATLFVVLIGAMAAYPLARNKSRRNTLVKTFVLSIMMIPALSLLVPLYVLLVRVRGISTLWGITPVHITFNLPLAIFLYANFIGTIPKDLDEAAIIDGCSVFRVFDRIVLPLLKPVTVSIIILTAVAVWNDYQFSVYFLQKPISRVVTLAIASFFGITGSDPNVAAAAALMAILPVTVLYLILQKYFVKGMVDSAVK